MRCDAQPRQLKEVARFLGNEVLEGLGMLEAHTKMLQGGTGWAMRATLLSRGGGL